MVKSVTAFESEDGQVFDSEHAAYEHEAEHALRKIDVFTQPTAAAIVKFADEVFEILRPLQKFRVSAMPEHLAEPLTEESR